MDYVESGEIEIARSYFVNLFSKKYCTKIVVFSNFKNILLNTQWKKIYKSFNANTFIYIFYSKFFFKLLFDFKKKKEIKNSISKILDNIKSKSDLVNIKYKDIELGREVYHEYIYRFRKPSVDLKDKLLPTIIKEGILLSEFWINFFENNNVKAITLTHPNVRLQALVGKIANQFFKIPVYSVTNTYIKKNLNLANHFVYHRNSVLNYRSNFNQLSSNEKKLALDWSKKRLEKRLSGEIGVDMHYTSHSAFSEKFIKQALRQNEKLKVLICTHEFFDDPNSTGGLLFPDFHEWLIFLAEKSKHTNYDWYIKNHPDCDVWTVNEIKRLIKIYDHLTLIDEQTSFKQLKAEGLDFVFTAHGTVGHECPLLDIQVVNADTNHPHIGYDFTWTPQTINELGSMISNLSSMNKKIDVNEIYEFYYAKNHFSGSDNLVYDSYNLAKKRERENKEDMIKIFLEDFNLQKHRLIIEKIDKYI